MKNIQRTCGLADQAGQVAGTAVHPHAELGQPEAGVLGGHDEVAAGGQHEAGPQGGAGDRADHGHGALLDGEEGLADVEHPLPHVVGVHRGEVVQVVAGAEVLPRPREDDRTHAGTDLVDVDEEVAQLPVHDEVDGVHRRPVHGHGGDATVQFRADAVHVVTVGCQLWSLRSVRS